MPGSSRSSTLDAIRGLAILLILLYHYWHSKISSYFPFAKSILDFAWTGVDLFFVLSGYLIGGILLDNRAAPNLYKVFYARRAMRILPLYLLSLIGFSLFASDPSRLVKDLAIYLTFTQNIFWASGHGV